MNKLLSFPLIISAIAIALFAWVANTMFTVWIFIPGVIITFIIYLNTFYKKAPDPERLLPVYLIALSIQFIHFLEEYLTDFVTVVPALMDQDPYPMDYWVTFNMIAYAVFLLGGIAIFKQNKVFMVVPLFFIIIGVIFNSIAHVLLAIYTGGYFSGLFTAIIYLFLIPVFIKRLS